MTQPISGHGPHVPAALPSVPGGPAAMPENGGNVSFQDLLLGSLRQTNALQQDAAAAVERSLLGGDITQAEVFTSVKKADLALRMMLQIRNKLVEAYQEVQQLRM